MLIAKIALINLLFIASFLLLLPHHPWLFGICSSGCIVLVIILLRRENQYHKSVLRALFNGLQNLYDGDFSISLTSHIAQKNDAVQHQLIALFNQVADKLREEKQSIYQRELLLNKVVNASDVVTVLVNHRNTVIFTNHAAQNLFNSTNLLGQTWLNLMQQQLPELLRHREKNNAVIQLVTKQSSDCLANAMSCPQQNDIEQSWLLARHFFKLNGASHELILLKPLSEELAQQELQTWKKVIKVLNHELNNSIAPISSMCHSGLILAERLNEPQLNRVFNSISGRINKLSEFIKNYSQFARLSSPQKKPFDIIKTIETLKSFYFLELTTPGNIVILNADEQQIEQLLINLLKNAKEVAPLEPIQVMIEIQHDQLQIIVRDYGEGMTKATMEKAFLPYFSTKTNGSGIGLSLCREVVDAHNGIISLSNHPEKGLQVFVRIPLGIK